MRGLLLLCLVAACSGGEKSRVAFNRTLTALEGGDYAAAEEAASAIEDEGLAAFVRANILFARSLTAEKQASAPEAEPFAFDVAIQLARRARDGWIAAALTRADWPEARRNAERALLKIAELEKKKSETEERRRKENAPDPRPAPPPPPPPSPPTTNATETTAADPTLLQTELSEAEISRVMETLARKEREKAALRRANRRTAPGQEGKDW